MRNLWSFGILLAAASAAAAQDMPLSQVIPARRGLAGRIRGMQVGRRAGRRRPRQRLRRRPRRAAALAHRQGRQGVAVHQDARVGPRPGRRGGRPGVRRPNRRRNGSSSSTRTARRSRADANLAASDLVLTKAGDCYCAVPDEKAVFLLGADGQKRQVAGDFALTGRPRPVERRRHAGRRRRGRQVHDRLPGAEERRPGCAGALLSVFGCGPKQPSDNAGLTLDAAGRAYATSREGVQVFDPTGRLSGVLVAPERAALARRGLRRGGPRPAVRGLRRQGVRAEDAGEGRQGGGGEGAVRLPCYGASVQHGDKGGEAWRNPLVVRQQAADCRDAASWRRCWRRGPACRRTESAPGA